MDIFTLTNNGTVASSNYPINLDGHEFIMSGGILRLLDSLNYSSTSANFKSFSKDSVSYTAGIIYELGTIVIDTSTGNLEGLDEQTGTFTAQVKNLYAWGMGFVVANTPVPLPTRIDFYYNSAQVGHPIWIGTQLFNDIIGIPIASVYFPLQYIETADTLTLFFRIDEDADLAVFGKVLSA